MIRTFEMHKIRKQKELTGCLWEFTPCQGEKAGKKYQVATPCCWESHPEFASYRGEGIYKTSFEAEGTIRLEFKGVCRHEDHPQFGCALPYAAMQADLELIKYLGANSVRTVHYPNDEIFLDLCDE